MADSNSNIQTPSAEIMGAALASVRLNRNRSSPTLIDLLASNTKSLWKLKLYKAPDYPAFALVQALKENTVVTTVDITWTFLRNVTEEDRGAILDTIGRLPNLEVITLEVVGPTSILTVALQNAQHLKSLSVGKLRLATQDDVMKLSQALSNCQRLESLSLSSIRVLVQGDHVMGNDGMVRFLETDNNNNNNHAATEKIVLDPLLDAMASLPTLEHIRLQHNLHGNKIQSPSQQSLRSLCRAPRKSLVFNSCGLVDEQCIAIADELASHRASPFLSILVVTRNSQISPRGWCAFVNMLEANYTIVDFHSGEEGQENEPSPDQKLKMAYFQKLNMAGRGRLLIDSTKANLRDGWIDFLVKGRNDLDLLFYALQTNPSLCHT